MAVATPARLPVPTREAMLMAKAWNDETCLPPSFLVPSPSRRTISGSMRTCTSLVLNENHRAHPISSTRTT